MPRKSIEDAALSLALSRRVGFDADRSKRVGASEAGQCMRKIVGIKLGQKTDVGQVETSGFATRGDHMEDAWIAPLYRSWFAANGAELLYSGQANQVTFTGKTVPLSATPDGLAVQVPRDILKPWGVDDIGKSQQLVAEFKSLDPRYGREKLPKSPHVPQIMTQLGMIRHATKYRPEWGFITYVDASDWFNVRHYPVRWSEKAFKSLINRAKNILSIKDWNQAPPEGKIQGGSECAECPFARQCLGFVPWLAGDDPRQLKPKQVASVETIAARVHAAEVVADKAKQAVRDAEADLYSVLNSVKRKFVMGKKYTISAKSTASQNRTSMAKLKAELTRLGVDPESQKFKEPTKPGTSLSVEVRG